MLLRHGNLKCSVMAKHFSRDTLDSLPYQLSRELFTRGRSVSLMTGETLFRAGDEGDGCYWVENGLLKVTVAAPKGVERILAIL
jgi:CRP/FNR family transcriptional regulator, cyclic AMP receptor protein